MPPLPKPPKKYQKIRPPKKVGLRQDMFLSIEYLQGNKLVIHPYAWGDMNVLWFLLCIPSQRVDLLRFARHFFVLRATPIVKHFLGRIFIWYFVRKKW